MLICKNFIRTLLIDLKKNELAEQLKLAKIADAEIGERIKVVVNFSVHFYVLAYVSGQTFRNIIDTPLITVKKEWQGLSQELKKWTKQLLFISFVNLEIEVEQHQKP